MCSYYNKYQVLCMTITICQLVLVALKLDNYLIYSSWLVVFTPTWICLCFALIVILYSLILAAFLLRSSDIGLNQRSSNILIALPVRLICNFFLTLFPCFNISYNINFNRNLVSDLSQQSQTLEGNDAADIQVLGPASDDRQRSKIGNFFKSFFETNYQSNQKDAFRSNHAIPKLSIYMPD